MWIHFLPPVNRVAGESCFCHHEQSWYRAWGLKVLLPLLWPLKPLVTTKTAVLVGGRENGPRPGGY